MGVGVQRQGALGSKKWGSLRLVWRQRVIELQVDVSEVRTGASLPESRDSPLGTQS